MQVKDSWLLPEGVEEVLPPQAERIEALSRRLLDLYRSWGYELVVPPLIEYLETLLTGTGNDLDLQTFKLTDQLNGRLMGVRADMTPQVARIDAHHLKRETPTRLCYLGTVLHTRPDGFAGSRSPLQVGVELYGHAGVESDVEVLSLMLESLAVTGVQQAYLDLGHVGVYRGLVREAALSEEQEATLFDALQRKAVPEIRECVEAWTLPAGLGEMFIALARLNGGPEVLAEARRDLGHASAEVQDAIGYLERVAALLAKRLPDVPLHYDLGELRGYHYHTGVIFAAFVPGHGQAVAQGGRYDGIARVFGRDRPATGFSADVHTLMVGGPTPSAVADGIFAPWAPDDAELQERIQAARKAGEKVISGLPGQHGGAREMGCDREFVKDKAGWQIASIGE